MLDRPKAPRTRTRRYVGAVLLAVIMAAAPILHKDRLQAQAPPPSTDSETLYARLGGYDAIARFVDTAFPRVAAHPELNHFFRGHSIDSQMRQRQLIIDYLCRASGGPCVYQGRPMPTVHEGLAVTDAHWSTFMSIIRTVAAELDLPPTAREGFVELIASQEEGVVLEP